ncbi:hypothetical protein SAMN04489864_10884 [Pedobacter insulae]|uniref:Uncharacterized protein n=1 Tax=Pedobacter insulae TaxID=414048 RepID=A0A1I2YU72_9SPHI|nr:hypothetical protein SAMN04489864_10884 [Pedobacter insulae]
MVNLIDKVGHFKYRQKPFNHLPIKILDSLILAYALNKLMIETKI